MCKNYICRSAELRVSFSVGVVEKAVEWNITTSKFSPSLKNSNISNEQPLELHRTAARQPGENRQMDLYETKYQRIQDQPDSHAPNNGVQLEAVTLKQLRLTPGPDGVSVSQFHPLLCTGCLCA